MMKISLIVVCDEQDGIGKENKLLCHLPADLKYFKQTTLGHHIVLGRKTYESVGRPLPGRTNIVISRDPALQIAGCIVLHSPEAAIEYAKEHGDTELFITGGGIIFKQTISKADRMYITRIHHTFDADTFFPPFDRSDWALTKAERHAADDKNPYDYTFEVYDRKIVL